MSQNHYERGNRYYPEEIKAQNLRDLEILVTEDKSTIPTTEIREAKGRLGTKGIQPRTFQAFAEKREKGRGVLEKLSKIEPNNRSGNEWDSLEREFEELFGEGLNANDIAEAAYKKAHKTDVVVSESIDERLQISDSSSSGGMTEEEIRVAQEKIKQGPIILEPEPEREIIEGRFRELPNVRLYSADEEQEGNHHYDIRVDLETATNNYRRVTPEAAKAVMGRLVSAGIVLDDQGRPAGSDYGYILKMTGDEIFEEAKKQREEEKKAPPIIILGAEGSSGGEKGSSPRRESKKTAREIEEYLTKNQEKLGRYLVFYVSGDPLGSTITGGVDEVETERTLKQMGYDVLGLTAADLVALGKDVYKTTEEFLDLIGADDSVLDIAEKMSLAQNEWINAMSRSKNGKWAGEIYEARKHLASPENVIEYQKAIGRHLQSREISDSIKEVLKSELIKLREGEISNIRTTEEALDFLRQLASQQALKGVEALNAEVYSAQFGEKARTVLFRKFPDLEKVFRAEVDVKESIAKISTEWKKLGDNPHALFRSFVDDKERIQPRSMPDLALWKLGALFELKTSFGERSYGQLVSNALKMTLEEVITADREITAGVARSSKNPYTDQMDPADVRVYFDNLAVKIANCGESFGVDPEVNKDEFTKRKAVVMDAIGVAKGLISVFGIAGKGNLYFSTYTEGDQLARLMEFRRGVDADRETHIERKVGAASAILKADKDGKFALKWLKLGLTFPEFVDIQNKKVGVAGIHLKDGAVLGMMEIMRRGDFHKIDWSRNNITYEKYLDFLGRSYLIYQMLVDKNPKHDIVNTKDSLKNVRLACITLVEDIYPSTDADVKQSLINDLIYQIFRVVITSHNPLDQDNPTNQWWTDKDFSAALENIYSSDVLPTSEYTMLSNIVRNRAAIVLKTPSNVKQVVSIDR